MRCVKFSLTVMASRRPKMGNGGRTLEVAMRRPAMECPSI